MTIKLRLPHNKNVNSIDITREMSIKELVKENNIKNESDFIFLGAIVDGRIKNLNYKLKGDENVILVDIANSLGTRVYTSTLILVYHMAQVKLFPDRQSIIDSFIGSSIYVEEEFGIPFTESDLNKIREEMQNIINSDIAITEEVWPREKAIKYFESQNRLDKVKLIETNNIKEVKLHRCGDYIDRFEGILAPSTGYIKDFELKYYYPGMLIVFPGNSNGYDARNEKEQPSLIKVFSDETKFAKILGVNYVGQMNEMIASGKARDLILISEAHMDKKYDNTVSEVLKDEAKRIVLISGPSSSGKTTTAQKLKVYFAMRGVNTVEISTDDYFVERSLTPKKENGEYDFESIDAVDIHKLNQDIMQLIEGKEIDRISFDFIEGKTEKTGDKIKLGPRDIIIIEGIHALNPILSREIPERNKFKIYLSALTTMNIDALNRLSTTDVRFLRRMVRDVRTRGRDVSSALSEWKNVREGEDIYVFPYQEDADIVINTSLIYEIAAIKKHALSLLQSVPEDDNNFVRATRLIETLSYFNSIDDDDLIPNTSILREFIDGSVFDK